MTQEKCDGMKYKTMDQPIRLVVRPKGKEEKQHCSVIDGHTNKEMVVILNFLVK